MVRPVLESEGGDVVGLEIIELCSGDNKSFRTRQTAWASVESEVSSRNNNN